LQRKSFAQLTSLIAHEPRSPVHAYTLLDAHLYRHAHRSFRIGMLQVHMPAWLVRSDWYGSQVDRPEDSTNSRE